jgi:hypothetical protein
MTEGSDVYIDIDSDWNEARVAVGGLDDAWRAEDNGENEANIWRVCRCRCLGRATGQWNGRR